MRIHPVLKKLVLSPRNENTALIHDETRSNEKDYEKVERLARNWNKIKKRLLHMVHVNQSFEYLFKDPAHYVKMKLQEESLLGKIRIRSIIFLYKAKGYWDLFVCFLIMYYIWMTPLRETFGWTSPKIIITENMCNILFFLDIFYCFRFDMTKMYDVQSALDYNPIKFQEKWDYFQNVFLLFICFPFDLVYPPLDLVRYLRVIQIPRLIKHFKAALEEVIYSFSKNPSLNATIVLVIYYLFYFMTIAHYFTCYWIYFSEKSDQENWLRQFLRFYCNKFCLLNGSVLLSLFDDSEAEVEKFSMKICSCHPLILRHNG